MLKWLKTILFVLGSAILAHWLPFSAFFKNVDTLIHEFGHAMVTLALSGQVIYIELNADQSGLTQSLVSQHWAMIPIALAGYMTASLFTWYLFKAYAGEKQRSALVVVTVVAIVALVLFVRAHAGAAWLLGFIGLNIVVLVFAGNKISRYYLLVIAFLSLEESVFGPIWLNYSAVRTPEGAGDATVLSHLTSIPALIWSAWFTLFALLCAKRAIGVFTKRSK
jgi:hypothetical protein